MEKPTCHNCKKTLKKGAFYHDYKNGFVKCKKCHQEDPILRNFQKAEVYSRVVGYFRSVDAWNKGKAEEWKDRVVFKIKNIFDGK